MYLAKHCFQSSFYITRPFKDINIFFSCFLFVCQKRDNLYGGCVRVHVVLDRRRLRGPHRRRHRHHDGRQRRRLRQLLGTHRGPHIRDLLAGNKTKQIID